MKIEITFSRNSVNWERELMYNQMFAAAQVDHLRYLYQRDGYLYLETVYSSFGLRWDPYDENKCWIHERDGDLKFQIFSEGIVPDKIQITIQN